MTLATKNGSLIVKDGQIAENCGCCGDWYCCTNFGPFESLRCPPADVLGNITVTVETGADCIKTQTFGGIDCQGAHQVNAKGIFITPSSSYAGTFALQPLGHNATTGVSTWRHDYPSDGAGCGGAHLLLSARNSLFAWGWQPSWTLSFFYNSYAWSKFARTMPSETKSLSDMKCEFAVIGATSSCFQTPREIYRSHRPSLQFEGRRNSCSREERRVYSGQLYIDTLSYSSDEKDRGHLTSSLTTTGSLSATLTLDIAIQ